jgi:soluble lytic murein transglycosylase-like protein
MSQNARRYCRVAAIAAGLSMLAVSPLPSARPHPPAVPALAAADFDAVGEWLDGVSSARPTAILTRADLAAALTPRPQRLAFFDEDAAQRAARRYLDHLPFGISIREAAERNRVDALLVASVVWAESKFAPRARSPRGALGLMQVQPATAARYGVANLFDPDVNLDVGSRYLGSLIDAYEGELALALAAYNAGPAVVSHYAGMPPYGETRRYVARVLARYAETQRHVEESALAAQDPFRPARVTLAGGVLPPPAVRAAR